MRIIVIGYGTAGLTSAGYAKIFNKKAEVIVFEKRSYAIYHPCSIPDVLSGEINTWDKIVEKAPRMSSFKVYTSSEVFDVDGNVVYAMTPSGDIKIPFDKLIIATGSTPLKPRSIPGIDLEGVYAIKTVEDGERIESNISKVKKVAVIGAGPLGIEAAFSLKKRGLDVYLFELKDTVLPGKIDPPIAKEVEKTLRQAGITVYTKTPLEEVKGKDKVESVVAGGEEFKVEIVILALGVKPNTSLAQKIGVKLSEKKAIKVNDRMETNIPSIYAAGDCVESWDVITGKPIMPFLANTAFQQGRVAGINAAGGEEYFKGSVLSWAIPVGEYSVGAVGLTSNMAKEYGFDPITISVKTTLQPKYYPQASPIHLRLIVSTEGRILGAQVYGKINPAYMLNFFSQAIYQKLSVKDLLGMEYLYTPAFVEIPDVVYKALEGASRRIRFT